MLSDFALPSHLSERCLFHKGPKVENPTFVLHWMRGAIRLDECPTFDVSCLISNSLNLPLLVYQGIDERYPHASYRHHRFLMEGAADIANRAEEMGVEYLVHISREGHREPVVKELAIQSAIVVTDLMDLGPWKKWTQSLTNYNSVIEVDSTCVLPRTIFGKSLDRPFRFKNATKKKFRQRLNLNWPEVEKTTISLPSSWEPPFKPVDIREELTKDGGRKILSYCDIDPTVVPVTDFTGGFSTAIEHWEKWCKNGIRSYHKTRNNAANRYGVSGMSPYIHYGMIAPTKIAREASEIGGKGAEKFLDELLIFREHAQHHCHKLVDPTSWNNLPEWAKISWNQRILTQDEKSQHMLEFGNSGDSLWDGAQIGLVRHGVMHNNVRMTWGKAFAKWIKDPETAMNTSLEFNDRYALDGRDPNSIAGVMWCFGLFDRPFSPSDLVMGNVRKRNTDTHQSRLDLQKYRNWTEKPTMENKLKIGIIGGGISGSFAAMLLKKLGHEVTIWDKGRGASGRLSAKKVTSNFSIQVGSRSLDNLPSWLERYVAEWIRLELVKLDGNSLTPIRPLSDIIKHLNKEVEVNYRSKVISLEEGNESAEIAVEKDNSIIKYQYDRVIVALPIEQAIEVCRPLELKIDGKSDSCWVVWGPYNKNIQIPNEWEAYRHSNGSEILEIRIENDNLFDRNKTDSETVIDLVTDELGIDSINWRAHFWKYAKSVKGPGERIHTGRVTIIGDGFGLPIGTVGGALESSGRAVSEIHLRKLI